MDELSNWYEVLRSLLPQRYPMRLSWERRAILVRSPWSEEIVWITEDELGAATPQTLVLAIRRHLRERELQDCYPSAR